MTLETPGAFVFSELNPDQDKVSEASVVPVTSPAVIAMEAFLDKYHISGPNLGRVAEAIIESSRKYNLDPRLVASIMIVESRANPFAISDRDSVGIMQIHLPTWSQTVDREGINLFKIEDNVDFGVRILKQYTSRYGLWQGVKRYKGWKAEDEDSSQSADDYVLKIQRIYARPQ